MKKILLLLLCVVPTCASASEIQFSSDFLDGTWVGEPVAYPGEQWPGSDKPGFYHEENSAEFALSVKYIYDFEKWDVETSFSIGQSELRKSNTSELGLRYRIDETHSVSMRYKGTYAREEYQLRNIPEEDRLDPKHQHSISNSEWAEWAIMRYQYNMQYNHNIPIYFGIEGATDLNNPALIEDDFSAFIGLQTKQYIAELKAGENLVFLKFGMRVNLSTK